MGSESVRRPNGQAIITVKLIPSRSPATLPEMDPMIWSRLPPEILELVLSFLPLKRFLNLMSTCKHFKSLLFSPPFVSKHSSSSSSSSSLPTFLLLSHPQTPHHLSLYDSFIGSWRDLFTSLSSSALLCTSKGLLCYSLPNSSSFILSNLLARSSRVIKFPIYPFFYELLTLVSIPSGYKIFTLCTSGSSSSSVFMYDSRFHSWRQFDGFEKILSDKYNREGVYFKGCLYFMTPEPFCVVCFDMESGKWQRMGLELPADLTFVRIVSDGERILYLIGGINGGNGISRSLKLWELSGEDREKDNWVEVGRLPEMMCRKLWSVCYHNYENVYCIWHDGMICVCCYIWPEILYFKVGRRTWHWMRKCPSLPEKWSFGFRWFSFVPDLYACV